MPGKPVQRYTILAEGSYEHAKIKRDLGVGDFRYSMESENGNSESALHGEAAERKDCKNTIFLQESELTCNEINFLLRCIDRLKSKLVHEQSVAVVNV